MAHVRLSELFGDKKNSPNPTTRKKNLKQQNKCLHFDPKFSAIAKYRFPVNFKCIENYGNDSFTSSSMAPAVHLMTTCATVSPTKNRIIPFPLALHNIKFYYVTLSFIACTGIEAL